MTAFSNLRLYILFMPLLFNGFEQRLSNKNVSIRDARNGSKNDVKIESTNGKIYLLQLLDEYNIFLYIRLSFVSGVLFTVYHTLVHNYRIIYLTDIIGLLLCLCSLFITYNVIKVTPKYQYSFPQKMNADHKLITNGVYGYIRHPAYLSNILKCIGHILVYDRNILIIIPSIIIISAQIQSIEFEEVSLRKKFGEKYIEYTNHVSYKLIPKVY